MPIIERHKSPDGLLELLVDLTADDWTIGFAEFPWHTHGDILHAKGYEGTPAAATRAFIDDIVSSRQPIVLTRIYGKLHDAHITSLDYESLKKSLAKYGRPGETLELRFWNGSSPAI